MGVSRTALRDRMGVLEAFGLISRRAGAGTRFQREFSPDGLTFALEVLLESGHLAKNDLYRAHVALERQAAIDACTVADRSGHVALMRASIERIDASYGTPEFIDVDVEFHRLLTLASENVVIKLFATALQGAPRRVSEEGSVSWQEKELGKNLLVAIHADIVDAIEAGAPRQAAEAMDNFYAVQATLFDWSH
jgi:DNA-binding FadR family transcriptional regulator